MSKSLHLRAPGIGHQRADAGEWSSRSTLRLKAEGRIYYGKDDASQPNVIRYLDEVEGFVPWTWWPAEEAGHTDESRKEIRRLLGSQTVFETAKPVRLIERLLQIVVPAGGIVMDFFAGSATVAHAVLSLNAADGHDRRFILVQVAEALDASNSSLGDEFATIADVAKERIRRSSVEVLGGSTHEDWNHDCGFRVLKIDTTNMTDLHRTPDALKQAGLELFANSVKPDRTGEDLLFQVLLDWGLELTMAVTTESINEHHVFILENDALIACFEPTVSTDVVSAIAERQPLRAVFRDSGFATDADRINAEQVFAERSPITDVKTI